VRSEGAISVQVSPLPLLLNTHSVGEMHEEEQTNSYQIYSVESEREVFLTFLVVPLDTQITNW